MLSMALLMRRHSPVAAACRCLSAIADEIWLSGAGGEVWTWFVGGVHRAGGSKEKQRRIREGDAAGYNT
ncbi:hypothetical protein T484DRAFT_2103683 [Baffinella frigidus]|nr:hypothetical protein T484DRAFT_2103683 [Cryptophyta sp. CCMP2293]